MMVTRHVRQDAPDEVTAFTKAPKGRELCAWRKETIERSFADAKENHGLRFARMLGLANMREQSFLTAAVQNMKRLVRAFFIPLLLAYSAHSNSHSPHLPESGCFVDGLQHPCDGMTYIHMPL